MPPLLITLLILFSVIAPLSYGATVNSGTPNDVGTIILCHASHEFSYSRAGAESVKIFLSSQSSVTWEVIREAGGNCDWTGPHVEPLADDGSSYNKTPYERIIASGADVTYTYGGVGKVTARATLVIHNDFLADVSAPHTVTKMITGNLPYTSTTAEPRTLTAHLSQENLLSCTGSWC
jgi:hypothetical protein